MRTLEEDIDDLDRMIENGAPKDEIRSQIRLIAREVAALKADYASLAEDHAKLNKAHLELQAERSHRESEDSPRFSASGGFIDHPGS